MRRTVIIGTGSYVPDNIISNDDLAKLVDTSDEWISSRTGIKERRISIKDTTTDMAYEAARLAIMNAGINTEDIDLIICATITPDYFMPSVACMVQERLKVDGAAALDLNAACTGFVYALVTASQFILTGMYNKALVIGVDAISKILDWEDRSTCVLFGDGAGTPGKYMPMWKEHGIKVIPVVPSVAIAIRMVRGGADALVAEGTEAGGHIGELTTMALVPQVVDAVDVPVIAAGGIADGRGLAAAFMLGADGVQVGTRFLSATECNIHPNYKQKIIAAKDIDTIVTGRSTGHPVRILKNKLAREYVRLEAGKASIEELEKLGAGALARAVIDGDMDYGSVMAGQIAALVKKEQSCKEIIKEMFAEADRLIASF